MTTATANDHLTAHTFPPHLPFPLPSWTEYSVSHSVSPPPTTFPPNKQANEQNTTTAHARTHAMLVFLSSARRPRLIQTEAAIYYATLSLSLSPPPPSPHTKILRLRDTQFAIPFFAHPRRVLPILPPPPSSSPHRDNPDLSKNNLQASRVFFSTHGARELPRGTKQTKRHLGFYATHVPSSPPPPSRPLLPPPASFSLSAYSF